MGRTVWIIQGDILMLASEIGNCYETYQKIAEIDQIVSSLRVSTKSLTVQVNNKGQGQSAAEAIVSTLINYYGGKRATLMAHLIAQGYTDG